MILIGELSLWVALLMAAWSALVSLAAARFAAAGAPRDDLALSGARALYATTVFLFCAALGLWAALLRHDFSFAVVASFSTANLPRLYTLAALWAGQSGSVLLWALILSAYASTAVAANRRRDRALMPVVTGVLGATLLCFVALLCFGANPYARLAWTPADGNGLNPQLQHPGMVIHPPLLYLGLVATAVPFAFAVAALVMRRFDRDWLATVRRWSLVSWFFLTLGIASGMWWAYAELGWGGYWAWDPVENAALLPWLTCTALLHTLVAQNRRGMFRAWNVALVMATFVLATLGGFVARGGVLAGVHAFVASPVGMWFVVPLLLAIGVTGWLVETRLRAVDAPPRRRRPVSREAALLYGNVTLIGIAIAILGGMLFPILAEAVRGTPTTAAAPVFRHLTYPLGLLLLLLMGMGPLTAWRRGSPAGLARRLAAPALSGVAAVVALRVLGMNDGWALAGDGLGVFALGAIADELVRGIAARRRRGDATLVALVRLIGRDRRRSGGYVVHAGVVILCAAFAGMAFRREQGTTLKTGAAFETIDPYGHHWRFVSLGVSNGEVLNRDVRSVALEVSRDGRPAGIISSEKRQYVDSQGNTIFEPFTEVGIRSTPREDVYVVLADVVDTDTVALRISFNPLVWWVWFGAVVVAVGGLIVMWPRADGAVAPGGPRAGRGGVRV